MIPGAMTSPSHLINFMTQSGRPWLVLPIRDLIQSQPWPQGVQALQEICEHFADFRRTQPTGRQVEVTHPQTGKVALVPQMHTDRLETWEIEHAIRYLMALGRSHDPQWDPKSVLLNA